MIKKFVSVVIVIILSALAGWFIHGLFGGKGGGRPPMMGPGQMPPAAVIVQVVKEQLLQPVDEYIAQVEPIQQVTIRPQISGMIAAVHFKEGDLVKEGDLLFTIQPDPFRAAVAVREAELAQANAALIRAQKFYDRMKSADVRSISKTDFDKAESDYLQAQAGVKQGEAGLNLARIDLGYTEIKAPISGRIGAAKITKGNYVTPAASMLASIVQIDPIRVTFSLTDREYLKFRQQEIAGSGNVRVAQARLPDGTILPTPGKKDFDDNAINPQTGTIVVRYLFSNPDGLLIPGGYVTALLRDQNAEKGIKIPQKAQLVDQQGTYVLAVDEKNSVSSVRITAGAQIGTDVTVLFGLKEGDRIIVDGVQKARPGATVNVIQAEVK